MNFLIVALTLIAISNEICFQFADGRVGVSVNALIQLMHDLYNYLEWLQLDKSNQSKVEAYGRR